MMDLSLRLLLCAGLTAAVGGAVLAFGHHERDVGRAEVRTQWDTAKQASAQTVITAQADTLATEHAQAAKAEEVDTHVQDQLAAMAADRDRAVRQLGSLRDTLAAIRARAVPGAPADPGEPAQTRALADSLGDCSQRYSAVAGERDGLAVQTAGLIALLPPE
jgi:hypothetical protein